MRSRRTRPTPSGPPSGCSTRTPPRPTCAVSSRRRATPSARCAASRTTRRPCGRSWRSGRRGSTNERAPNPPAPGETRDSGLETRSRPAPSLEFRVSCCDGEVVVSGPPRWGFTFPLEGVPLSEHREVLQEAERLGYTDAWTAEVDGYDAFVPLALAAAWTYRIRLGTAIANVFTRGPALLAMEAAAMADAAPGRFCLGIGSRSPAILQPLNRLPGPPPGGGRRSNPCAGRSPARRCR